MKKNINEWKVINSKTYKVVKDKDSKVTSIFGSEYLIIIIVVLFIIGIISYILIKYHKKVVKND